MSFTSKDDTRLSAGKLRGLAMLFALLLGAAIFGSILIGVRVADGISEIHKDWNDYTRTTETKGFYLSQMRGHFGYGGFIHNFKNYVLRQDEGLVEKINHHLSVLRETIGKYSGIGVSGQESEALKEILGVIEKYEASIEIARSSASLGRMPVETDRLVRVDDRPALEAMAVLGEVWLSARAEATKGLSAGVLQSQGLIKSGIFLLPVLLIAGIVMMWFLRILVREIDDRTKAEKRTRSVVDNAVDGIITIDGNCMVESFNPAAEGIFGYTADEVIGRNVNMLMPEPYHGEHDGYVGNYLSTAEKKIIGSGREVEGRRKDGSVFPMDLGVSEMKLGSHSLFTGIVRDITDRKEIERMKNEFISTVSHELRTPLTSIQGSLAIISRADPQGLDAKYKKLIAIAVKNSSRLVRLINDILDIEKIESGRMEFKTKPQEIMPLIHHAIESNQGFADQFSVRLKLMEGVEGAMIDADTDRFAQVMANLLSNAAKFSPEGGCVDVSVSSVDGMVRVAVRDHGNGIPKEFRGQIFGKFAQADSSAARKREGTGLGLNIAKAIVELHGGKIDFETKTGVGTSFFFELEEWRPEAPVVKPGEKGFPGSRILICEDEPDIASLLKITIEQGGMACDVAHTASQARKLLETNIYSAMTLDLMLPDQDGISLLRELRSSVRTRDLPVIVVSAVAEDGRDEIKGETLDVVDWMEKPIDQDRLREMVKLACGRGDASKHKVLHVEDDRDLVSVVSSYLTDSVDIISAFTLAEARKKLSDCDFDLVLLDVELPDGSGLDLLPMMRKSDGSAIPVVLFSAHEVPGEIADKVEASLVKSVTDMNKVVETLFSVIKSSKGGGKFSDLDKNSVNLRNVNGGESK